MTLIGYHASHEQYAPSELLGHVRAADAAGFQGVMCADHFHPWLEEDGHSGFAWSWLEWRGTQRAHHWAAVAPQTRAQRAAARVCRDHPCALAWGDRHALWASDGRGRLPVLPTEGVAPPRRHGGLRADRGMDWWVGGRPHHDRPTAGGHGADDRGVPPRRGRGEAGHRSARLVVGSERSRRAAQRTRAVAAQHAPAATCCGRSACPTSSAPPRSS